LRGHIIGIAVDVAFHGTSADCGCPLSITDYHARASTPI